MKYIKAAALAVLVLMLHGCCGTEPNDLAYVVALGFDKAEGDNYLMTIQFARPTNISGGASESGGSGQQIVENIAVEAPDIYAGISTANHIVSKRFTLAHSKLVVFSEEVAREGIWDIMETISRSEEIRPDIYLAVAKDSARKYLYEVKPVVEINPARYYQLIYEQHCSAGLPMKNAVEFYFDEMSGVSDSVLPLAGVIKSNEEESSGGEGGGGDTGGDSGGEEKSSTQDPEKTENKEQKKAPENKSGFEFRIRDYKAGEVAVNQENKSEAMGMVIFKKGKGIMEVGSTQSEMFKMLNGTFKTSYLTFENDKKEPVTIRAWQKRKPKYDIDKKKRKINIKLAYESDLYSLPADYNLEDDIAGFEEQVKKEIKRAAEEFIQEIVKEKDADILGLRKKFRGCFLTNAQFEETKNAVMDYDISVDVKFKIRRIGLTMKEAEE